MNNTTTRTTLTAIAAILIAATLVVGIGTFAAAHSAYAYQKKGDKGNGNGNGNTVTAQKNKQDGTQSGFDNLFEEEGQNLICTHPGNNATCVEEEGAAAQAPQPTTSLRVIKTVVCLPTDPDCSLPPTCTI